jgi:hypothetical protein
VAILNCVHGQACLPLTLSSRIEGFGETNLNNHAGVCARVIPHGEGGGACRNVHELNECQTTLAIAVGGNKQEQLG